MIFNRHQNSFLQEYEHKKQEDHNRKSARRKSQLYSELAN